MTSADDVPDASDAELYANRDQLRAMAHPLRLRIMERVGRRGTARAADIAAELGLPANSVSYHLRILARGGVVTEAPEAARDKRDRVWKLTQSSFQSRSSPRPIRDASTSDPDYDEASSAISLAAFDWMRATWAAGPRLPDGTDPEQPGPPEHRALVATSLRISREQARELSDLIGEKITEYNGLNRTESGANAPGDPDTEGPAADYQVLFALALDPHEPQPAQDSVESPS